MKNYQGNTSLKGQKVIDNATKIIETAQARINEIEARTDTSNDTGEQTHTATATGNGRTFAVLMLLSEILLLVCIAYANYYQHRAVVESSVQGKETAPTAKETVPAPASKNTTYTIPQRAVGFHSSPTASEQAPPAPTQPASKQRSCQHCQKTYTYNHAKQKFCDEKCRVANWEQTNGRAVKKNGGKP
jgi:hypothetical protein